MRPDFWSLAKDAWSRARRFEERRCGACGYDLRGLFAPDDVFRCPECGEETHRHDAIVPVKHRRSWWKRLRVPVLIVLAGCLLWVVAGWATVLVLTPLVLLALVGGSLRTLRPTTNVGRSLPLLAQRLGRLRARTNLDRVLSDTLQPPDPPVRTVKAVARILATTRTIRSWTPIDPSIALRINS